MKTDLQRENNWSKGKKKETEAFSLHLAIFPYGPLSTALLLLKGRERAWVNLLYIEPDQVHQAAQQLCAFFCV